MKMNRNENKTTGKSYKIEIVRTHEFENSISFDFKWEDFTFYSWKVKEGIYGLFVSPPTRKGRAGKYYSYMHCPIEFIDAVLEEVKEHCNLA